ncbi:MAG: serine/threonine-protein kinase [Planctomycetota bacterium]|nr:serine/threonine-protein kinase [Planctomycetota bacterium]
MTRSQRVQNLLLAASELPADQRAALLDSACQDDPTIRDEVVSLLISLDGAGRFMSEPTIEVPSSEYTPDGPTLNSGTGDAALPLREGPGTKIGPYKILQQIGEGGFGSVFLAQQDVPVQRKVAIKIIKLGMDTRVVVARFEQERQALAMMDHPNIAKVLDAGATETGRPFFVMELVKGDPINTFCDKNNLSISDRLDLFAQVCTAVQHAHTKGIIHRDIKPSNILVSIQDGRPYAKVIDFGIAKATEARLTERTLFTAHRELIGTPEYMSPEQAQGSVDIDTRTDIYSLGVLLYELLTGTTPFSGQELRSAAYDEIQRIIRDVEPPRPSTRLSQITDQIGRIASSRGTEARKLGVLVRGELDWIVMKAMDKDRARRYETANGFAADVRRFLGGEAIVAAPPSALYRLRKSARRHRTAVSVSVAFGAALLVGMVTFAWQATLARNQRDIAVDAQLAEAQQRALADAHRDRAVAAEAQASKRAGELAAVSAFQASMLSQVDTTAAGTRLMDGITERFATAMLKAGVPEDDRRTRAAVFVKELGIVNATDTATDLIDRTILKPAIAAVGERFKDQPLVAASLRFSLAEQYKGLGRYDDAETLETQVVDVRRKLLGDDHLDTLRAINDLGSILEAKGDAVRAEQCYREAVERRRRLLGPDDLETLTTMGNLGNLLRDQGKFDLAEPLLKDSLDGLRRVKGPESRDTLIAMNTYGFLLISRGNPSDAEPYWREAYETGKRLFGSDDPDVLVWTHNMGGLLSSQGKYAESEKYYRETVATARRVHGLEHPNTLACMMMLGSTLQSLNKLDEAEQFAREAYEVRARTLGKDHPDTLTSMANLGVLLRSAFKLDEAETLLKGALDLRMASQGKTHPATLQSMGMLGGLYLEEGRYDEAEVLYRDILELSKNIWNDESPTRLIYMNNLGNLLLGRDRADEAEPYLRKSYETRLRISGPNHPETLNTISNLARMLEMQGKFDEAERLYRDAVEGFRRVKGNDSVSTWNALSNLAGFFKVAKRPGEGLVFIQEALDSSVRVLGADHPQTFLFRTSMAAVLIADEKATQALAILEPFEAKAREILVRAHASKRSYFFLTLGRARAAVATNPQQFAAAEAQLLEAGELIKYPQPSPRDTRDLARSMVALHTAWDRVEPGQGHDAKAAEWKAKLQSVR